MAKIKKEKEKEEVRVARENFTDEELDEFDKKLELYRTDVKIGGEPARILTLGGRLARLRDKGIIKVDGELTKRMNCMSECPKWKIYENKIIDFQEFENEIKALKFKRGKKDFAGQMELKHFDGIAKKMPRSINFKREDDNKTDEG